MLRLAGSFLLFGIVAPVHLASKALIGRSPWPSRFLSAVGWMMGARVEVKGEALTPHSLVIANHTSWFDIVILGGHLRSAFVAKDDLGHGFIHWLADQNGTIYVRRSHVKGAKDQAVALARALERRQPVTIFPEATTGPGTHLLPFRSTLLEAANFAARDVELRPVAIDYAGARGEVAWFDDEPGLTNVWRLLGRKGTLPVTINLLAPLDRGNDRKQLTQAAREAIGETLGLTSPGPSPIGGAE